MKSSLFLFAALAIIALPAQSFADPLPAIPLWTGDAPGEADQEIGEEETKVRTPTSSITHNVTVPTVTIYPAADALNTGTAVLVAPGGGYQGLAVKHEGSAVCEWLNSLGISAILLKYRVPRRKNLDKHHAALQDAQRAMSILRSRAAEWKIDPKRIGMLGFSAGGHLTTMMLTSANERTYPIEAIDKTNSLPDFGILIYPAYLKSDTDPNQLAPEIKVTKNTPPAMMVIGHQDKKWVEGNALFYLAMQRAGRECELHIFGKGGHGFGIQDGPERVRRWPKVAESWMLEMGFLKKAAKK